MLHPADVRIPGDVGAQVLRRLVGAVELLDLGAHVGVEALEVVCCGGAGEVQAVVLPDFDVVELPGALVDLHDRVQRQLQLPGDRDGLVAGFDVHIVLDGAEQPLGAAQQALEPEGIEADAGCQLPVSGGFFRECGAQVGEHVNPPCRQRAEQSQCRHGAKASFREWAASIAFWRCPQPS